MGQVGVEVGILEGSPLGKVVGVKVGSPDGADVGKFVVGIADGTDEGLSLPPTQSRSDVVPATEFGLSTGHKAHNTELPLL